MRLLLSLAGLALFFTLAAGAEELSVLHRFGYGPAHPATPPDVGTDGLLYGSTEPADASTPAQFYRVTAAGKLENLGSIAPPPSATSVNWVSRLSPGPDGKLWGVASAIYNGVAQDGVVFTISTDGTIQSYACHGVVRGAPVLPGPNGKMYTLWVSWNGSLEMTRFDSVTQQVQLGSLPQDPCSWPPPASAWWAATFRPERPPSLPSMPTAPRRISPTCRTVKFHSAW